MRTCFASSASGLGGGIGTLLAREIGAARLEQSDLIFNQVEAVVKNLLAGHFPPSTSQLHAGSLYHHFERSNYDPENPLMASVTAAQKLAVKALLSTESRKAQEVKRDAFQWIYGQFDKILDGPEQDYKQCFEEIWSFFRRLYQCGQGRVIAYFYVDAPRYDWAEQEKLQMFTREVVAVDLLAAKPEALELMAFAANDFSMPFAFGAFEFPRDIHWIMEMSQRRISVYAEGLSNWLVSHLASLGVPLAEDALVDRTLTHGECGEGWNRFDRVCRKLAALGNSRAQECFGKVLEKRLSSDTLSAEDLSASRQTVHWLLASCPITSCGVLARALEEGKIGRLAIELSAEKRLELLKQRFSAGDQSAGSALSRIYESNWISDLPLGLSPLEQVAAIERLAERSGSCSVHKSLTNIYSTNRIGESALSFSLEERCKRIEALARKGISEASRIMLTAYLSNQLSLPCEMSFSGFPSGEEMEEELEILPLNLTDEERLEKLYALAVAGHTSAIIPISRYVEEHSQALDLGAWRPLLFGLLLRRQSVGWSRELLGFSQNQARIIELLSSFHTALNE